MAEHYPQALPNNSYALNTRVEFQHQGRPTTDHNETCRLDDAALRVPLALFYSLFFLFGLAGNLLALWVFLRVHSKKNSVRVFLINVALADLILVTCLPFRVAYHASHNRWDLGPALCKVVGHIFYMNMYISIVLLGFISVDRYLKIQRASSRLRFLKTRWSVVVCCILWGLAITSTITIIALSGGNEESHYKQCKCFQYKQYKKAKWRAYFNLLLVALFWVVYVALVISYGKIAMKLLRVSKEKPDLPNAAKYNRTAQKSFFVLFLFTLCFVPYHVQRIFYILSQIEETSCYWRNVMDKTNELALLLSAFNSCLDPVMYFLLSSSVRKAMLQIVNNVFRTQPSAGVSSTSSIKLGKNLQKQATVSTACRETLIQTLHPEI